MLGSAQTGWVLDPPITIPPEATDIVVTADGQVQYSTATDPTLQNAGQIQLAKFVNPDGLLKLGDNLYQQTDASGDADRPATRATTATAIFGRALWKRRTSSRCRS